MSTNYGELKNTIETMLKENKSEMQVLIGYDNEEEKDFITKNYAVISESSDSEGNFLAIRNTENLTIKLSELKQKYVDVLDDIHTEKADGNLAKLCNLRDKFDETFDTFFDREELRVKYTNAWNSENDEPNFDISNGDLEEMLNSEDLQELITFYEGYISDLEDELIDLKSNYEINYEN